MELAASAGLILDPAQRLVLEGALGEAPDGRWAAFEVALVEARQNGKGAVTTARQLAGLYLFGEELQTHTAHRMDATKLGFQKLRELIEGSPDLSRRVKTITEAHGEERIELRSPRQQVIFKTRAKGSGRGFSGDVVYLDECFYLLDLGSLLPTMSARPNPQLWYTSSAPLPRAESDILRSLCRRGRRGGAGKAGRLAYFEWSASTDPGPMPEADPDSIEMSEWREAWRAALAEANPALGIRLSEEFSENERAAMTPDDFARERLTIFPEDLNAAAEPAIDSADWAACTSPASKRGNPLVLAFEVSVDRRWSVIAAAGPSTLTGTHVEVIENRRGTTWTIDRLLELRDAHSPAAILCNPAGPAGGLLPAAEKAGLVVGMPDPATGKVRGLSSRDYAQACAAAYDAITEHQWRHIDQPELNMAATGAAKRTIGDAWVFDRRGSIDISPLLAVTIAAWAAGRQTAPPKSPAEFILI